MNTSNTTIGMTVEYFTVEAWHIKINNLKSMSLGSYLNKQWVAWGSFSPAKKPAAPSFFLPPPDPSSQQPLLSAISHLPIPSSASMGAPNHPHGQPCLWPIACPAFLVHGGPPPFLPQMSWKGEKSFPQAPLTSKGVYSYIVLYFLGINLNNLLAHLSLNYFLCI